jgi:hypothetical protein
MKVGDFIVERLHAWGVRRIYGYPGDGINGVIGALQRADKIEFIQVRHEEMAAFMAVAHAKFTGEIGVCLSTGGPGATHLITGLYDAKLDHARIQPPPVAGRPPPLLESAQVARELEDQAGRLSLNRTRARCSPEKNSPNGHRQPHERPVARAKVAGVIAAVDGLLSTW